MKFDGVVCEPVDICFHDWKQTTVTRGGKNRITGWECAKCGETTSQLYNNQRYVCCMNRVAEGHKKGCLRI